MSKKKIIVLVIALGAVATVGAITTTAHADTVINSTATPDDGHVVTLPESKTNSNTKTAVGSVKGAAKNIVMAPAVKPVQVQSQARNEARNINVTAPVASAIMIAEKGTNQTQNGKRLSQTGNVNSILAMALGSMLAMFGIGITENKKRN